jgi:adenosylcobinamide-GDP ribazoletransferase
MKGAQLLHHLQRSLYQFGGAIAFYTSLPIPSTWPLEFAGIARWAPLIGLMIGGCLGFVDHAFQIVDMPILTRSALVVGSWILLTGGLHLDGAMDTADGLAVQDPKRQLEVMADSKTGAFGVMAAIAILILKTTALTDLESNRILALMAVAGWGRWGQLVAIAYYPYLKSEGKGAFHKATIQVPWDLLPGLLGLLGLSGLQIIFDRTGWPLAIGTMVGGSAITFAIGAWLNYKLGGHTGDTYGAIVEWTEAILLCFLTTW